jgi:hypothetical protein
VGEHRAGVVIEFERSLLVPVDPAEAFVLADMSRLWEWNPAVRSSELVSGMPLTTGARYRQAGRSIDGAADYLRSRTANPGN